MRKRLSGAAHFSQLDSLDCGPSCVRIAAKHLGRFISRSDIEALSVRTKLGMSLRSLCELANRIGLKTTPVRCEVEDVLESPTLPFIAHWNQNHFVVVLAVTARSVLVSDPAAPRPLWFSYDDFKKNWCIDLSNGNSSGIAVFVEPTEVFYDFDSSHENSSGIGKYARVAAALRPQAPYLRQLSLAIAVGAILTLFVPFSMKALLDGGIANYDARLIFALIIMQFVLYAGIEFSDAAKRWLFLHLSARVHLSLISRFAHHLLKLPMSFFASRNLGDVLARMEDHRRVEVFLTSKVVDSFIAAVMLFVYGAVLFAIKLELGLILLSGLAFYVGWILLFQRRRAELDYRRFSLESRTRGVEVRLVEGIEDIKVTASEGRQLRRWEDAQFGLYKTNVQTLKLDLWQQVGARSIIRTLSLTIIFSTALSVIDGELSIGTLLAIVMVLSQIEGPLGQLMDLIRTYQDAELSLSRINAVWDEKKEDAQLLFPVEPSVDGSIKFDNVSFSYGGDTGKVALKDICLTIPQGGTLAIVGHSGAGKTTLLKLILKLYLPTRGSIRVGSANLAEIPAENWRKQCGVVLQDGRLFNDSILRNVATGLEPVDWERFHSALKMSMSEEFVMALPQRYDTRVGDDGVGLSVGQKQRILLARALYIKPALLCLDEATSALDAMNETAIMENLSKLPYPVTSIVLAHRLSTVRNADEIVVLKNGEIVEKGTHETLLERHGTYFDLIQKQLEHIAQT